MAPVVAEVARAARCFIERVRLGPMRDANEKFNR